MPLRKHKVALPGTPLAVVIGNQGMGIKCMPPFDKTCLIVIMKTGFDAPNMLISREIPLTPSEQLSLNPEKNYVVDSGSNTYTEAPNLTITNFENYILVTY